MAADIRPVLTLRPRLTRTFQLFDPYDPGRAKPPKQPVKSGVTPTSFMHQPRGVEGTRTSETGSESRFLPRGGCPGGWTLAPEIPGRAGRSSLRQLPTIPNSRAEPKIVVEHSAKSLTPHDRSGLANLSGLWNDQSIAEPLVISFTMIMGHELVNRLSQRAFSEQNHPLQGDSLILRTNLSA